MNPIGYRDIKIKRLFSKIPIWIIYCSFADWDIIWDNHIKLTFISQFLQSKVRPNLPPA